MATLVLSFKKKFIDNHNSYTPIASEIYGELRMANEWVFYPSRWYTSAPNFKGKYVQTDMYGFRINPESVQEKYSIGYWGGSTMFSITTSQSNTIPGKLEFKQFNSLNFGQGGYSTNSELIAFIEGIRAYPNIKIAFFYDGVNEVARYLEWAQKPKQNNLLYQKIGYYYEAGILTAIKNSQPFYEITYKSNFLYLISKVFIASRIQKTNNNDVEIMAKQIVDIYYENISDIRSIAVSKGITPVFSWQPTIFTTQKKLTPREMRIADDKSLVKPLYIEVTKQILNDKRKNSFNFIDLTSALDNLEGDIFSDWCHINEMGNSEVANKIKPYLVIFTKQKFH